MCKWSVWYVYYNAITIFFKYSIVIIVNNTVLYTLKLLED